ncbi:MULTISPECIES: hypothetical protein [Virgibacillus]|uniref:Uncharacterized protein n=1 Tax=Virgibacillus dokdonensis TaxID=302167 RepID=A0A2K9J303_9BACI|nr:MULTISPECIES: hypothetical protein [Virgibacillus]AUJ26074.1 hypothetical protein A21D_03032 [Virgibacillus dokdonensis]
MGSRKNFYSYIRYGLNEGKQRRIHNILLLHKCDQNKTHGKGSNDKEFNGVVGQLKM